MIADALLMWAHAVNKSIQNGDNPRNGLQLTSYISNSKIQGMTGVINIDKNGDRRDPWKVCATEMLYRPMDKQNYYYCIGSKRKLTT